MKRTIDDSLRNAANGRIRIVLSGARDGRAGAAVTAGKPRQRANRLVTDRCVGIGGQNINEICHHGGYANFLVATSLAGKTMQGAFAD